MKVSLTQDLVRKLRPEHKPKDLDDKGKLVFEENPDLTKYILFDAAQDAPPGFGVRVYPTKKTYILQRRVGDKVIKATVGNCADMLLTTARERALKMALEMKDFRVNPNTAKRVAEEREKSLLFGHILESHRDHLITRTVRPATPATVKVLNRIYRKFESVGWTDKALSEIHTICHLRCV